MQNLSLQHSTGLAQEWWKDRFSIKLENLALLSLKSLTTPISKGQLISEGNFGAFKSPKKTTKF